MYIILCDFMLSFIDSQKIRKIKLFNNRKLFYTYNMYKYYRGKYINLTHRGVISKENS